MLLSKIGRTQFESKSQQQCWRRQWRPCCYQRSEEPSLKANHNSVSIFNSTLFVVIKDRKNPVWKQITTENIFGKHFNKLLSKIGRTQFESKSQLKAYRFHTKESCYQRSEEPSLKANHNEPCREDQSKRVVIKDRKNPVWKQITTCKLVPCK